MIKRPMLDLDITVLYTIAILWVLLVILNKIYYKPVGKIINERENRAETETAEIENLKTRILDRSEKIELVLKKARKDSILLSEELIKKGEVSRNQMIITARQRAADEFKENMAELDTQIRGAEEKLKSEITVFSKKIEEIFS
jgi:F-type H+-transporting ATPase subunit b